MSEFHKIQTYFIFNYAWFKYIIAVSSAPLYQDPGFFRVLEYLSIQ